MAESKPIVVAVDGIISVGKSTLIKVLSSGLVQKGYRVAVVKEPVELWKEDGSLQMFYSDPRRRAFQFQCRVFHDRIQECIKIYESCGDNVDIYIMERSIFTDVLFMKSLMSQGLADEREYNDYMKMWSMWSRLTPFDVDLFIYLKANMDVVMDRLDKRGRESEKSITVEYQVHLQEIHDRFFEGGVARIREDHLIPVLMIDSSQDILNSELGADRIVSLFDRKIKEILNNRS